MDTQRLVSGLATVCTIALFLTGIPTCKKILRKGNTSDASSFPFLVMFSGCTLWVKYGLMRGDQTLVLVNAVGASLNLVSYTVFIPIESRALNIPTLEDSNRRAGCTLWVKYGLMRGDQTLVLVNAVGASLNLVFVAIYYANTGNKTLIHKQITFSCVILFPMLFWSLLHKQITFCCIILFPMLCYVKYWARDFDIAAGKLGAFCALIGILSYGAPLSAVRDVIRSRSTECMAFPLSLGNFICAVLWVTYGTLIGDLFVKVPNMCGIILGAVQLSLFCVYRRSHSTDAVTQL